MVKLIVSEFPKWASNLNILIRILVHVKYLISGYLKWKISELISFHLKTIAKHMVLVTILGMLKLLVLMLVSVPLKFQISFQCS